MASKRRIRDLDFRQGIFRMSSGQGQHICLRRTTQKAPERCNPGPVVAPGMLRISSSHSLRAPHISHCAEAL